LLFRHPDLPGRTVRLATCMNLWPAENPAGIRAGLEAISVPLRDRLIGASGTFGVGLWLPARALEVLDREPGERAALLDFLQAERLDVFTLNAFPFGDFHSKGLKAGVFEPDWTTPERAAFTRSAILLGRDIAQRAQWGPDRHLSVSTHTGGHTSRIADPVAFRAQVAAALGSLERELASEVDGFPYVVGLEPEPRSLAGDTRELVDLWDALDAAKATQNMGVCLDACHAAVEFEDAGAAQRRALGVGRAAPRKLAKLQFSSALRLLNPAQNPDGFRALVALDEPVYLHQVTGRGADGLVRAGDLPEVAGDPATWQALDELRCHFHVPVDLASHGGLDTTSEYAGTILKGLLASPEVWGTTELHVEIETYTWTLGGAPPDLVDGIEAEYRHVIGLLAKAGWHTKAAS